MRGLMPSAVSLPYSLARPHSAYGLIATSCDDLLPLRLGGLRLRPLDLFRCLD